jgi:hypothetical protein
MIAGHFSSQLCTIPILAIDRIVFRSLSLLVVQRIHRVTKKVIYMLLHLLIIVHLTRLSLWN